MKESILVSRYRLRHDDKRIHGHLDCGCEEAIGNLRWRKWLEPAAMNSDSELFDLASDGRLGAG